MAGDSNIHRPKSKYAQWEEPTQEGEPFDYDAVPERFYFEIESIGNLEQSFSKASRFFSRS
jgi:hypothetical protein